MKEERKINNRISWIDTAKGYGIILVVIGHVLRGLVSSNLFLDNLSLINYIDFTIYSFHMPLFFILSGFLYYRNLKLKSFKDYIVFIKRKSISIMVPYFIFSWVQICVKLVMSNSVNNEVSVLNFLTVFIQPIEQFWFLYSLMLIFIFISFLDLNIQNDKVKLCIVIIIFMCIKLLNIQWGILSNALSYMFYFFIARYLCYYRDIFNSNKNIFYGIMLFLLLNILVYTQSRLILNFDLITQVILALLGSYLICVISEKFKLSIINYIGRYSMSIYLLHIIFGSGVRIVLVKFGFLNFYIHLIIGSLIGVLMPIIISIIYNLVCQFKSDNYLSKTKQLE